MRIPMNLLTNSARQSSNSGSSTGICPDYSVVTSSSILRPRGQWDADCYREVTVPRIV
jgi:hypothetical protein